MRAIIRPILLAAACAAAAPAYAQVNATLATSCQGPESTSGFRGTLQSELREAARTAGIADPRGVVVVEMRNRRARVTAFRSNVPENVSQAVVARHAEHLAGWSECNGVVNVRLDSLQAAGTAERIPVLVNADELARETRRLSATQSSAPGRGTRRVTLHLVMLVTRDGEVAHATLKRSSGDSEIDRQLLLAARRLRFRPAGIGGVATDLWVEQPVDLDLPNR